MDQTPREQSPADHVVLLDENGAPQGVAPRATVHTPDTPLHLAFSCWVLGPDGRVLVTRRALTKRTWPGVWTNAFCGHPRLDEPMVAAVERHARHELDLQLSEIVCVLPDFRYRAVDASGIVENEICPVHLARALDTPRPRADEVMDLRWVELEALTSAVAAAPWLVSPWAAEQLPQIRATIEQRLGR